MDKYEELYNKLTEQGGIKQISLEDFRVKLSSDDKYREQLFAGLTENEENFNKSYEEFSNTYEAVSQEIEEPITLDFPESDFELTEDLFDNEKITGFRMSYGPMGISSVEQDNDGIAIPGVVGEFINKLPFGEFVDDQFRAVMDGREDVDVQKAAHEMISANKPTIKQAQKLLRELQESRNTLKSDEEKAFYEDIEKNGNTFFGTVKAMGQNPQGAVAGFTRSMSSMVTSENLGVMVGSVVTSGAIGAATGGPLGIIPGLASGLTAGMIASGANTDLAMSYANFFADELPEDYTEDDLRSLLDDEKKMQSFENKALARGIAIAAITAMTAGIGSKVGANVYKNGRRGAKANAEAFAKITPITMAGDGLGEIGAQGAAGQERDMVAVAQEMFLNTPITLSTQVTGLSMDIASDPAYSINKSLTGKEDFIRRFDSFTDEQVKSVKLDVYNDEAVSKHVNARMDEISLKESIKKTYGNMDEEQTRRLTALEQEIKKIGKPKNGIEEARVSEIKNEIKDVVNIYNEQQEIIGVLNAPYYSKEVDNIEDASKKRQTKEYQTYISKASNLATTMGLQVESIDDGIGGYYLDDGTYLQELSSTVFLKDATYQQAIDYASILGAINPETQESTIAGMIVNENEGDANQYSFQIESKTDLEDVRAALIELGFEYTLNESTGEVGIIDWNSKKDADFNKNIVTFSEVLISNEINHEQKYERIRSKYISADDRATNLGRIKQNTSQYGQSGESVRYVTEQAEKRNQQYLDSKTPKKENLQAPDPLPPQTNRVKVALGIAKAKRRARRILYDTFYTDGGLTSEQGDVIRQVKRDKAASSVVPLFHAQMFYDDYKKTVGKISKEEGDIFASLIDKYLRGDKGVEIPENFKAHLDVMRNDMDNAQDNVVKIITETAKKRGLKGEQLKATEELINTIQNSKGSYMVQAYSAFEDLSYMQDLLDNPALARDIVNQGYDNLVFETAQDQGITIQEAKEQVDQYIADTFQAEDKNSFSEQALSGKINTPFFKKKNKLLTDAFKRFLGEINDPFFNYTNTMEKLSTFAANVTFQTTLSDNLLETGVASLKPERATGKTQRILDVKQYQTKTFDFLNDLYVDQEFKDAYNSVQSLNAPKGVYAQWLKIQGSVKMGKTIFAPTTTARNYLSGVLIAGMNGHNILNPFNFSTARKSMKLAWDKKKSTTEQKELVAELVRLGVTKDGGISQEIIEILNDINSYEGLSRSGKQLDPGTFKKYRDAVTRVYQFGDDFYKTFAYFQKKTAFQEYGMTEEEASEKAAYRVRKGQPTYSELPLNIRKLRRMPLTGSFVSFPYLITKAHKENLKFIAEDFKEGRTKMALQHAANYSAFSAFPFALAAGSKAYFGISDEEEEAILDTAPDYYRDANLLFQGRNEDGSIQYLDLNSIAPAATITKPLSILLKERTGRGDFIERIPEATYSFLEPYVAPEILAGAAVSVYTGVDLRTGRKIKDNTEYLTNALGPGVLNNIRNIGKTMNLLDGKINPFTGKEYRIEDEIYALAGFRTQTFDWDLQVSSFVRNSKQKITEEVIKERVKVFSQLDLPISKLKDVYIDIEEKNIEVSESLLSQVDVARKLGKTEKEIVGTFLKSGLGVAQINLLMKGEYLGIGYIDNKTIENQKATFENFPEQQENIVKNIDSYQSIVSENAEQTKVMNKIFDMYEQGKSPESVERYIGKASRNFVSEHQVNALTGERLKEGKEIMDEYKKKGRDFWKLYSTIIPELQQNSLFNSRDMGIRNQARMVIEKDPTVKSLLMFKFLGEDAKKPYAIEGLKAEIERMSGGKVNETTMGILQWRIKNAK